MDREAWKATVHGGHKESNTTEMTEHKVTKRETQQGSRKDKSGAWDEHTGTIP